MHIITSIHNYVLVELKSDVHYICSVNMYCLHFFNLSLSWEFGNNESSLHTI